jgi:hypothetical protein
MSHRYKVGDKVIFTNIFGVCWGVKTITSLEYRPTTRDDNGPQRPCYHYANSDTPWFPTDEETLRLADEEDLIMDLWGFGDLSFFQRKYGFKPTETYGCW